MRLGSKGCLVDSTAEIARYERRALTRRAFIDSLPIFMGYSTMGFAAGVLLAIKADVVLSPLWAFLTSTLWVTCTMSVAAVPEIAARTSPLWIAAVTIAVNFRYSFYGVSLLSRWRNFPLWKKLYLIFMLTDENYALEAACPIRNERRYLHYCTRLSLFNHSYWVLGVTLGALTVVALGCVVDHAMIQRCTNGIEFSMAALFLVIFIDQIRGMIVR